MRPHKKLSINLMKHFSKFINYFNPRGKLYGDLNYIITIYADSIFKKYNIHTVELLVYNKPKTKKILYIPEFILFDDTIHDKIIAPCSKDILNAFIPYMLKEIYESYHTRYNIVELYTYIDEKKSLLDMLGYTTNFYFALPFWYNSAMFKNILINDIVFRDGENLGYKMLCANYLFTPIFALECAMDPLHKMISHYFSMIRFICGNEIKVIINNKEVAERIPKETFRLNKDDFETEARYYLDNKSFKLACTYDTTSSNFINYRQLETYDTIKFY